MRFLFICYSVSGVKGVSHFSKFQALGPGKKLVVNMIAFKNATKICKSDKVCGQMVQCGTIQYSYCRKVAVPPMAAISHIDDMCRAQGWGDPILIY